MKRRLILLVTLVCLLGASAAAASPLVTMHGLVVLGRDGSDPEYQFLATPDGHVISLYVPAGPNSSLPPVGSVVDVRGYDERYPGDVYPSLSLDGAGTWVKSRGTVARLVVHGKVGKISAGYSLTNGKYVADGSSFVSFVMPHWRMVGGKPVIGGYHDATAFPLTPALRAKVAPWQWDYKLRPGDRATWSFSLQLRTRQGSQSWWVLVAVTPDP